MILTNNGIERFQPLFHIKLTHWHSCITKSSLGQNLRKFQIELNWFTAPYLRFCINIRFSVCIKIKSLFFRKSLINQKNSYVRKFSLTKTKKCSTWQQNATLNDGIRTPVGTGRVLARMDRKNVDKMYTVKFTNILYK